MSTSVAIVGAGISGLTCGVLLQERGLKTIIIAKDISPDTTSDISAALWYPYKAKPVDKVLKWGEISIHTFLKLAENGKSGVSIIPVIELLDTMETEPWWKDIVLNFRMTGQEEVPADYGGGYHFEAPLIEMPQYMKYLKKRYLAKGGTIKKLEHPLQSFDPIFEDHYITINCTGLGSKELIGDSNLFPIRGQVVVVENVGLDYCLIDLKAKRSLTYIIPRQNDCILGGTSEDNKWEEIISPTKRQDILAKCQELVPDLSNAEVISEKVGLRPARANGVRLELEQITGEKILIHNYGHGGAGVTLSWGCAHEVLNLLNKAT